MASEPAVHIIDDDNAMRDSLIFLLGTVNLEAKAYDSAAAFLESQSGIQNGCIVTDVRMPGMSGIELLRRLRELKVQVPVIIITGHGDIPLAVEAMKSGAADFIEKPFDDEVLLAAVRAALRSQADLAQKQLARAAIVDKVGALSNRERDVLQGLVSGKPNKTIAFDLGISPRTVEIYRANVMSKMEAKSLSDLVRMALVSGVIAAADGTERPDKG